MVRFRAPLIIERSEFSRSNSRPSIHLDHNHFELEHLEVLRPRESNCFIGTWSHSESVLFSNFKSVGGIGSLGFPFHLGIVEFPSIFVIIVDLKLRFPLKFNYLDCK